jgi:hypothetical protein
MYCSLRGFLLICAELYPTFLERKTRGIYLPYFRSVTIPYFRPDLIFDPLRYLISVPLRPAEIEWLSDYVRRLLASEILFVLSFIKGVASGAVEAKAVQPCGSTFDRA